MGCHMSLSIKKLLLAVGLFMILISGCSAKTCLETVDDNCFDNYFDNYFKVSFATEHEVYSTDLSTMNLLMSVTSICACKNHDNCSVYIIRRLYPVSAEIKRNDSWETMATNRRFPIGPDWEFPLLCNVPRLQKMFFFNYFRDRHGTKQINILSPGYYRIGLNVNIYNTSYEIVHSESIWAKFVVSDE